MDAIMNTEEKLDLVTKTLIDVVGRLETLALSTAPISSGEFAKVFYTAKGVLKSVGAGPRISNERIKEIILSLGPCNIEMRGELIFLENKNIRCRPELRIINFDGYALRFETNFSSPGSISGTDLQDFVDCLAKFREIERVVRYEHENGAV